jgi:mannose-6-phosphate isomerase-like protein (cupin superfamily)
MSLLITVETTEPLHAQQVAVTHRLLPPCSGGKASYGHRHKTQEEFYYVICGTLQFKLEDEVIDVSAVSAERVAPAVTRSIWNDGPGDAELMIHPSDLECVPVPHSCCAPFRR